MNMIYFIDWNIVSFYHSNSPYIHYDFFFFIVILDHDHTMQCLNLNIPDVFQPESHILLYFFFIRKNTYENSENLKIDMQASMYI